MGLAGDARQRAARVGCRAALGARCGGRARGRVFARAAQAAGAGTISGAEWGLHRCAMAFRHLTGLEVRPDEMRGLLAARWPPRQPEGFQRYQRRGIDRATGAQR
ncbi:MAG: hypothetical protein R3E68_07170 [Burkholderiaceae bacterium]